MISHLEVRKRKIGLWEQAILQGYEVFRELNKKKELVVKVDMIRRELKIAH